MTYIGIDPGVSGAVALIHRGVEHFVKNDSSEHDIDQFIGEWSGITDCCAFIERVSAMPKQGVSSTFKFGQSYGFLRGLLVAHSIPFEEVSPRRWQSVMGCLTGGDKNISKARAQQLFPHIKVTHAIADALLIAEYCRRVKSGELERATA